MHIPKTAGNSVREALRQRGVLLNPGYIKSEREHHFASRKAYRVFGSHLSFTSNKFPCFLDDDNFYKSDIKFTVVRNPFDLLFSYYHHYIDNSIKKNWIDNGWANVNDHHKIKNFEHFIDVYTSIDPEEWHVPSLCKNLFGQVFDDNGNCVVDYCLFVETLEGGICDLLNKLRRVSINSIKLLNKNSSKSIPSKSYLEYYNNDMVKKVKKKCSWELDNFGYSDSQTIDINIKSISNLKI